MITGHGGNIWAVARAAGCAPEDIVDMSSNVNPFGPMPGLYDHLHEKRTTITALPEPDAATLAAAFGRFYRVPAARVLPAAGTTWWIHALPLALSSRRAVIFGPTYADYADACRTHGTSFVEINACSENNFLTERAQWQGRIQPGDLVFICNPNNPTGTLAPKAEVADLCLRHPRSIFVIDESYLPFVDRADDRSLAGASLPNVVVLNSMSKMFRIPGLRVGFLIGPAQLVETFKARMLPWPLTSLAQAAAHYIFSNPTAARSFMDESRQKLAAERAFVFSALKHIPGLTVFDTVTTFFLLQLPPGWTAPRVLSETLKQRILIRDCSNFSGLDKNFIRISLKDHTANQMLVDIFRKIWPPAKGTLP